MEAITYAWLGGDSVSARVKPEFPQKGTTGGGETPPAPVETEAPEQTEPPTETEPPVDLTGSYWVKDEWDQPESFRDLFFKQYLLTDIPFNRSTATHALYGRDQSLAYGEAHITSVDQSSTMLNTLGNGANLIDWLEEKWKNTEGKEGWEPGSIHQYTLIVYVPENIPDDQYQALKQKANEYEYIVYNSFYAQHDDRDPDFFVGIHIERAGGNYDYGSETTP